MRNVPKVLLRKSQILFLVAASVLVPICVLAEDIRTPVVAHWIVPMRYFDLESNGATLQNDVRAALELGLDGFAIDAFSGNQAKGLMSAFIVAADSIGATTFKFFLSADMSLNFSAAEIIDVMQQFGANPHYLKINNHPLLSTYGGGSLGNVWWQDKVLSPLKEKGMTVTFIPYFDRPNPNADDPSYENWGKVLQNFPSVDGLFNFLVPGSTPFSSNDERIGHHWWSTIEADEALSRAVHDSGKLYMATYMPYYWAVCHPARQYMEHQGGRGMDNWWSSIIRNQKPDIVQIVTWNDYSESTFIQPTRIPATKFPGIGSQPHLGYYELLKYYISWFHAGTPPRIVKDGFFVFYRLHPKDAHAGNDASACSLGPIPSHQRWGKIEDAVYVTSVLTASSDLVVRFGGTQRMYPLTAGKHELEVPFGIGTPTFELWRGGKLLAKLKGPPVVEKPMVYNFNVYSGYAIAAGDSSETWVPSEKWKSGLTADWFK